MGDSLADEVGMMPEPTPIEVLNAIPPIRAGDTFDQAGLYRALIACIVDQEARLAVLEKERDARSQTD